MRTILLLLLTCSLYYGCKKVRGCRPQKHEYKFEAAKQIDTSRLQITDDRFAYYNFQVKEGASLVFQYVYQFEDCPDIADDEGVRTIVFEVPATTNSFKIMDSAALQQSKVLVRMSCECLPYMPVFFKNGFIEGQKISNDKWHIKAELKAPWSADHTIAFDQTFTKK